MMMMNPLLRYCAGELVIIEMMIVITWNGHEQQQQQQQYEMILTSPTHPCIEYSLPTAAAAAAAASH